MREHNTSQKGAKYTAARRPVKLVYYQDYPDRSSASRAEAAVKSLTRTQKQALLSGFQRSSTQSILK